MLISDIINDKKLNELKKIQNLNMEASLKEYLASQLLILFLKEEIEKRDFEIRELKLSSEDWTTDMEDLVDPNFKEIKCRSKGAKCG